MGKREYLPLQIAQQMINQEPDVRKYIRLKDLSVESLEEHIRFMLSDDFQDPNYIGRLKEFDNYCSPSYLLYSSVLR